MTYQKYSNDLKSQILEAIKNNELTVAGASNQYGVHVKTIYGWIHKGIGGVDPNISKLKKLEREKDDLLKIIGSLTVVVEDLKKKDKEN
jgi:transposase-like protein